jgi:polysaccharide biosynthesis protein PslA
MTDAPLNTSWCNSDHVGSWSSAGAERAAFGRRAWSGRMVSDAVKLFDVLAICGAGVLSCWAYSLWVGTEIADRGQYALGETLAALLFVALCQYRRGYALNRLTELTGQLRTIARTLVCAGGLLAGACFLLKISADFSRGWALLWIATTGLVLAMGRVGISLAVRRLIHAGYLRRRRAVIGEEAALGPLLAALRDGSEEPAEIVRVFSYARGAQLMKAGSMPGDEEALVTALRSLPVDEIIVACPEGRGDSLKPLIDRLKVLPADIRLTLPQIARQLPVRGTSMAGSVPLIDVAVHPIKHWHVLLKSALDRGLALVLTLLLSPLLLILALLIKLDSRGPLFFVQERFGFNNNVIRVIKFRTMYVERADPSGALHTVRGDRRITRIGRRLRAHSLDELPQLFNVLRGEMSLVGPRPHALAMKAGERLYHEVVDDYFARHRVKPGITGWAQVNGLRGEITSPEAARRRVDYDLHYIDHWSLWFDLKILLMSLKVMFVTENAF